MQTHLLRVAPPLKIGLLFKATPSEYSFIGDCIKQSRLGTWTKASSKAEWTTFKFDFHLSVAKICEKSHSPLSCTSALHLFFFFSFLFFSSILAEVTISDQNLSTLHPSIHQCFPDPLCNSLIETLLLQGKNNCLSTVLRKEVAFLYLQEITLFYICIVCSNILLVWKKSMVHTVF